MSTTGGGETYIQNGQVMHGPRPISIGDHLMHLANLAVFFVTSIVSTTPINQQVAQFNGTRTRNYGGNSNVNSNNRVGGSSPGKKSNINTFGPAAQSGCTGGS